MIRKFFHWFFCKINDPIWSPSLTMFASGKVCCHCKRVHGQVIYEVRDGKAFLSFADWIIFTLGCADSDMKKKLINTKQYMERLGMRVSQG